MAPGTSVDGPISYESDPLAAALIYGGCGPSYCFCKNNPDVEIDARKEKH